MNWILLAIVSYVIIVIVVSLHIIYDTPSTAKALAYVLVVIVSAGYRHRNILYRRAQLP